jgi:hypothetical protein
MCTRDRALSPAFLKHVIGSLPEFLSLARERQRILSRTLLTKMHLRAIKDATHRTTDAETLEELHDLANKSRTNAFLQHQKIDADYDFLKEKIANNQAIIALLYKKHDEFGIPLE